VVLSSPAVADGVVYVCSGEGNLDAVNAATGALMWQFPTGGTLESSATVVNGVIYFTSDDGFIHAVSTTNHTEQWNFPLAKRCPFLVLRRWSTVCST
jgi:outer membrane protein assembly factor BamB